MFGPIPDPGRRRPPVTWLASYPRSGNTLLRAILHRCFNQPSQSIYNDNEFSDPVLNKLVGHEAVGRDAQAFISHALDRRQSLYVKTHELPTADQHPTIYVVRDGRAAAVSHLHYLREIAGIEATLREVIEGKYFLTWGAHVKAWALSNRPNTLVLKFEDLINANPATLEAISFFIDRPIERKFGLPFDMLHARNPLFFRCGSNEQNIAEMSSCDSKLFEKLHGKALRQMGYISKLDAHSVSANSS